MNEIEDVPTDNVFSASTKNLLQLRIRKANNAVRIDNDHNLGNVLDEQPQHGIAPIPESDEILSFLALRNLSLLTDTCSSKD